MGRLCFRQKGQWYGIEHIESIKPDISIDSIINNNARERERVVILIAYQRDKREMTYLEQICPFLGITSRETHCNYEFVTLERVLYDI